MTMTRTGTLDAGVALKPRAPRPGYKRVCQGAAGQYRVEARETGASPLYQPVDDVPFVIMPDRY